MSPPRHLGRDRRSPETTLTALSVRIVFLQQETDRVAAFEQRAENEGEFRAARQYHRKQVALTQQRHRLIDKLCRLPATSPATRSAKSAALMTLIALDESGLPEYPNDWPLWSALKDLAAEWSAASDPSSPTASG